MSSEKLERYVSRLKEGDTRAFDYIYERTHRAVYFAVYYILRDKMLAEDGSPFTAHTTALVPFILADYANTGRTLTDTQGALCDIAPTLLNLMGLNPPKTMTGKSLLA